MDRPSRPRFDAARRRADNARTPRRGVCRGAKPCGLPAHSAIVSDSLVIPSEQVQQAVGQQHRDLGHQSLASRLRLAARRGHADDDVPEEARVRARDVSFELRERQNVGRAIFLSIDSIQILDLIVAGEKDGKFRPRHLECPQHGARAPADLGSRESRMRTPFDDEPDGHDDRRYARPFAV